MNESRLKYYLEVWKEWMLSERYGRGYPSKAAGFSSSGIGGFDDLSEQVEKADALAVDAVIEGLHPAQRVAIHHFHLSAVYKIRDIERQYESALDNLWRGLLARGLS
jgi:hypothetical protein